MCMARYYVLQMTPAEKALVHSALVGLKLQFEEEKGTFEKRLDQMIYRMQVLPELKDDEQIL